MHNTYPLDCSVPLKKPQLKTLWNTVSSDLRTELGDSTFDLWFTDFKLAKIENDIEIQVPLFINENDKIKVDIKQTKYIERVK